MLFSERFETIGNKHSYLLLATYLYFIPKLQNVFVLAPRMERELRINPSVSISIKWMRFGLTADALHHILRGDGTAQ